MRRAYKNARVAAMQEPLLLSITEYPKKIQQYIENLIPFSTGIEIECLHGEACEVLSDRYKHLFMNDPYQESDGNDLRGRLHPGSKGLLGLKVLTDTLKKEAHINPKSGIHYHIDCSDVKNFNEFSQFVCEREQSTIILNALGCWNYKGDYNKKEVKAGSYNESWVRVQSYFKTIEFRIGEMTFDYEVMSKRIAHAQKLVANLKREYKKSKNNKKICLKY